MPDDTAAINVPWHMRTHNCPAALDYQSSMQMYITL